MTPDDWRTCSDPQRMLSWLREQDKLSERKARLYAVSVCRSLWPQLTDQRSRTAVEVAERYADGQASVQELHEARSVAELVPWGEVRNLAVFTTSENAFTAAELATYTYGWAAAAYEEPHPRADDCRFAARMLLSPLLHDVVQPFRTASDRAWRSSSVVALATAIYTDRSFDSLPELAARLASDGCDDAELLDHLMSGGPHAGRGCWGLDALVGKG